MKLYFYRGIKPNFGDELNHWMWPKLIEDVWEEDDSIFLGIGSIILDGFPVDKKKIVFGAGYGGYTVLPNIDKNWKFYFVRGKQTAKTVGIDESLGIGDSAILLRSLVKNKVEKRYKVSFMPHWTSAIDGNWARVCELSNINYIDPCTPVDTVLDQILASELVITEAMHGAIVSDALRVPWIAAKPMSDTHVMKWFDWASPLEINLQQHDITCSSLLELLILHYHEKNSWITHKLRRRGGFLAHIAKETFAHRAADRLISISKNVAPTLSSDSAIERSHNQMLSKLDELVTDLGRGKLIY